MLAFDELLPDILPECPGVSDPLALREIRNAVIRLCDEAFILKQSASGVVVTADNPRVVIDVPAGKNLVHLQSVTLDGEPVEKKSEDAFDLEGPRAWRIQRDDRPCHYYLEIGDQTVMRLVGIPTRAFDSLAYRMILKPLRSATEVEDFVIEDYYQGLKDGAIAGLLNIPKKPWTDLQSAMVYLARFNDAIADARGQAARDFTRDDESVLRVQGYS